MTEAEAKHVVSAILEKQQLEQCVKDVQEQIKEVEADIDSLARPRCPNGGATVVINGKRETYTPQSSGGSGGNARERMLLYLIGKSDQLERLERYYMNQIRMVSRFIDCVFNSKNLDNYEKRFLQDRLLKRWSIGKLQTEYMVQNPYRKTVRLLKKVELATLFDKREEV